MVLSIAFGISKCATRPNDVTNAGGRNDQMPHLPPQVPVLAPAQNTDPRYTLSRHNKIEQYQEFLQRNANRAMAYAAVFDLTQDESFLRDAITKFPNDLDLLARGAWVSTDLTFAVECAKALSGLQPKNPIGDYLTALLLIRGGGSPTEAKNAIMEGIRKGTPDSLDARAITARREALESAGESAFDARIHSLYGPISLGGIGTQLRRATNLLIEGQDFELIAGVAGLAQHFYQDDQHSIVTKIGAAGAQLDLLNRLPGDYEFGEDGTPVHKQAEVLQTQASELMEMIDNFESIYDSLSESERVSYADSVLAIGETKAMRQLVGERAGK